MRRVAFFAAAAMVATACSRSLPASLPEAPEIELGEDVSALTSRYPTVVMSTRVPGGAAYEIASSKLPEGASSVRCLFLQGRLALVRVHLSSAASSATTWERFVAEHARRYGPPSALPVPRLEMDSLGDSVAWSQEGRAVVVGRSTDDPPRFTVAVVTTALIPTLARVE